MCKYRLHYVQTPCKLCANAYYIMSKHLLRYVQTPITLCANTYYVLVNAFLTQIKTKRINDMHFENEEN